MAYTAVDDPEAHFQCVLYTGTGSEQAITLGGDTDMSPTLVWSKSRSNGTSNNFADSVRGATKVLEGESTAAEATNANSLTAFGSDGFTVGTDSGWNGDTRTFVAWCWAGGTTSGIAGSADITPNAYSFNQTSGFSCVTYNGTDVNGDTVLHGLGAVPHFMIVKRRPSSGYDWVVYHKDDVAGLYLNNVTVNNDSSSTNIWFHGQTPTSTQFHIGTDGRIGDDVSAGAFVAYLFAPKQGFSKFGKYTGNANADGPFIYTGFKPAWVLIKNADGGDNWSLADNKRPGYNSSQDTLYPNLANAEVTTTNWVDFYSNGFKMVTTTENGSGVAYIYAAFAEAPFVNSNGVPGNAR